VMIFNLLFGGYDLWVLCYVGGIDFDLLFNVFFC